jgi:hypothetical protein
LQVKSDDRDDFGNGAAMAHQRCIGRIGKGGQAQQPGMIPKIGQQPRFSQCLGSISANSCDPDQGHRTREIGPIHLFSRQLQDRFKESDTWISNGKLRGMNANCQAARARGYIVASKSPLASFIQAPLRG